MVGVGQELDPTGLEYLERSLLLCTLEVGIEDVLRRCADSMEAGETPEPIEMLASWLMRNNPRHNGEAKRRILEYRQEHSVRESSTNGDARA